jgi:hypothetical protein
LERYRSRPTWLPAVECGFHPRSFEEDGGCRRCLHWILTMCPHSHLNRYMYFHYRCIGNIVVVTISQCLLTSCPPCICGACCYCDWHVGKGYGYIMVLKCAVSDGRIYICDVCCCCDWRVETGWNIVCSKIYYSVASTLSRGILNSVASSFDCDSGKVSVDKLWMVVAPILITLGCLGEGKY